MANKAIMNDSIIKSSFLRQGIASFPPPVNLTTASCCASRKRLVPTCLFIALLSVRAAESKLVSLPLQLLLCEINPLPKGWEAHGDYHSQFEKTHQSLLLQKLFLLYGYVLIENLITIIVSFFNGWPQFFIKIHFFIKSFGFYCHTNPFDLYFFLFL